MRACSVEGCGKPKRSAMYCAMHWNRLQRYGTLDAKQPRHGGHTLPEYSVWEAMWARCTNPNNSAFYRYGGRGITVCVRWKSFALFLADMGRRPGVLTIERVDNDAGYSPDNCRWASRTEQQNNTRRNKFVEVRGVVVTIAEAARILGRAYGTIHTRYRKGLDIETGERHAS